MADSPAQTVGDVPEENRKIAARLREYAELLEQQGEDGFRVRAHRSAAAYLDRLQEPLSDLLERGGTEALIGLPGIGRAIAADIVEMLTSGRWRQLDRLKGEVTPEALFRTIPGIGATLAHRIAGAGDIETLEELEMALRLGDARISGIGPRRRQAILASLSECLSRFQRAPLQGQPREEPPVSLLLDADALYRRKAEAGELTRIAPKRFNPEGQAWLPIMHARRGDWHLTVLFSNTARAHELNRTLDWVVIYFHRDGEPEARRTIVTERRGPLRGRRVVRGRESECEAHYAAPPEALRAQ
ncbi:helix-hairpin-helix domain-containing protein [Histidinibacterium aquaticum]|uniref:DNA-binding protein n=1 Tax=Histidinibacterium aquaticum TaxID=2613962 RepID=A0A5J5GAZ4_9RHOB|nr:helix-hairpin-helix domain-containing protein [Histidinibacterium aquaticum]KAA9004982.1 DNA-binding protein [Histidinibacterium aquaticum]